MRNAGLEEAQAGIKIARRNISNLRYADTTTLMAENEEELKSLLMKVKEESEKVGLKPTGCVDLKLVVPCQGYRSPHPYPSPSGAEWIRTMAKLLPIYSMIVKALSDLGKLKARMYERKGTRHRDAKGTGDN